MSSCVSVIVFRLETGEILRVVLCPDADADKQSGDGESYVFGNADDIRQYIENGAITDRPVSAVAVDKHEVPADGVTPVLLQAVAGTLTVGTETYEIETGEIELTFGTPGEYRIQLEAFPCLPFEAVIHAY